MTSTPTTHCRNGHNLRDAGVYRTRGEVRCKTCHLEGIAKSKARKMAARDHPEEIIPSEHARFLSKIAEQASGCWEWQACDNGLGYGFFSIAGVNQLAHRVSYRHFRGPIADGLELDHLCRNRRCVNPDHLEPVTHLVNMRRALPYRVV